MTVGENAGKIFRLGIKPLPVTRSAGHGRWGESVYIEVEKFSSRETSVTEKELILFSLSPSPLII